MDANARAASLSELKHVRRKGNVLAVVVLFKRSFDVVPCALRLREWLAAPAALPPHLNLGHCLIYDNSPEAQPLEWHASDANIEVFHDASNGGTRGAYLYALQVAIEHGYPWILFLDHDTQLPIDFFAAAEQALSLTAGDGAVCAIVPTVFDDHQQISPYRITPYGRGFAGHGAEAAARGNTTLAAIASASLVRAESLRAILPMPAPLVLDHLDHWIFRELQLRGEGIVMSSARVEHSLSVQSLQTIDVDRYRAILEGELAYLRSGPDYSLITHFGWHVIRTCKLILSTRRLALVKVSAKFAWTILRT